MKYFKNITSQYSKQSYYLDIIEISKNMTLSFENGKENIEMYRGNFKIDDTTIEKIDLNFIRAENNESSLLLVFKKNSIEFSLSIQEENKLLVIRFNDSFPVGFNRLVIKFKATEDEAIFGCGEQFSYFNLRGYNFPLFTGEQGVGRNKNTEITKIADKFDKAGGDYYTTFYPQPTFISSRSYFLCANTYSYCEFNFTNQEYHMFKFFEIPESIVIGKAKTIKDTVSKLSNYLGRQELLPEWTYDGLLYGFQGGSKLMNKYIEQAKYNNIPLSGVWIQDWEGVNFTSFGKRLLWNWMHDKELYPTLEDDIKLLEKENTKVLGYINPYLAKDKSLCIEAEQKGFLATTHDNKTYYVDFGEFDCGIVDLTNPDAFEWFKKVIEIFVKIGDEVYFHNFCFYGNIILLGSI